MFERPKTRLLGLEQIVRAAQAAAAGNGPIHLSNRRSREEQGQHLQAMIDRNQEERRASEVAAEAAAATPSVEPALCDTLERTNWPTLYRVTAYQYRPTDLQQFECRATLFNERLSLMVRWTVRQPDTRLSSGAPLVRVSWAKHMPTSLEGCLTVDRIVVLERPEPSANLFQTIPSDWVRDRALVRHGVELMDRLPRHFRHLFNAIFWDGRRFNRFCTGPSSMRHHHADQNGNLRHSLEVALGLRREFEEPVLNDRPSVDKDPRMWGNEVSLAVMAGLLHDAGKADEYWLNRDGRYTMSDRGRLLGHKLTVVEWIAAATAKWRIAIPEALYLDLIHSMTSANGAPEWLAIRRPATLAANYLSNLDRMSGSRDIAIRAAGTPPVAGSRWKM